MRSKKASAFTCITTEGALLPSDLLELIASGSADLEGLNPESYNLAPGERIGAAVSRSWSRVTGLWAAFCKHVQALPENDLATGATRDRWLMPLFDELGFGRLPKHRAVEIEGKSYPISHMWEHTPVHLVGSRIDLDKRTPGATGAARSSPHSMVQEFLNRSDGHLWAVVTNGLRLRILRNNVSFTRQAYVEFDLEAMMEGEVYSDFVLLWMVCHASRFAGERPEQCMLEKWSRTAQERGTRALDSLRNGVEKAIAALGSGFLARGLNPGLKEKLNSGALDKQDYYRQLLRLVYRLLFLFVAEDRDLLLAGDTDSEARERYTRWYSTARLRILSQRPRTGGRHVDLGRLLFLIFDKMETGSPELGLAPLGGFLWSRQAVADLADCDIHNENLLAAIRALAWTVENRVRMPVDFKNLGAEELGSVYESLLELHPELDPGSGHFELTTAAGHERKSTGSYYTPTSLIMCLLDSALDPVLDEAAQKENPEQAILALKVCDPACGSGHFLVAAAHRMAKRLASVRTGDEEPDPAEVRHALREVIGNCIYGVDINPMSVELCKVSLWMEAMEPGRPLSFLDHHIQCGNSLVGATPALLENGIPDDVFKPIEGDDKEVCKEYKKLNRAFRKTGLQSLFDSPVGFPWDKLGNLPAAMLKLRAIDDSTIGGVKQRQAEYEQLVHSSGYEYGRLLADAWCAAFVWKKIPDREHPYPITQELFRKIEQNPHNLSSAHKDEVRQLARQYRFFHWHLAFPDVFRVPAEGETPENRQTGWSGGFDCVLGNPPWERIKLQEKEWFAERVPEIADAPNAAARQRMIAKLREEDPALHTAFLEDRRKAEGESCLARDSGLYPLCGRGDVNTYTIFAELGRNLLSPYGRVGCIVPSGIATDDTTKYFFQDLMDTGSLVSLYDFENRNALFPGVHRSYKFCLLTMAGYARPAGSAADFVFFALNTTDLNEDERHFTLSANEIVLINPNTRTCPIFRRKQDAELTKAIYRRVPVLIREADPDNGIPEENPWGIRFMTMFHMSNDSKLFRTREQLESEGLTLDGNCFVGKGREYLPLYEAKMIHHFDHRWATYMPDGSTRDMTVREKQDPQCLPMPRYWVAAREVYLRVSNLPQGLIRALKSNDREAALLEFTRLLFGLHLHEAVKGAADNAAQRLYPEWLAFVRKHQFARKIAPTLMGLSANKGKPAPGDDGFLPTVPEDDINGSAQDNVLWHAADSQAVRDCLETAGGYADVICEVPGLSTAKDTLDFAEKCLKDTSPKWLMGWRDITNSTNERTVIGCIVTVTALSNKLPVMFLSDHYKDALCLYADICSFAHDYPSRQKLGGTTLNFFIYKQMPYLPPSQYEKQPTISGMLQTRFIELIATNSSAISFINEFGYHGPPFKWNQARRFVIRCELDAAFFHLYLGTEEEWRARGTEELLQYFPTPRDAVSYIMDTFPIVRRKDEAAHGSYRTKETILDIYDRMTEVMRENAKARAEGRKPTAVFQSSLTPPPGPPTDADGNFIPVEDWDPDHWPEHIHEQKDSNNG